MRIVRWSAKIRYNYRIGVISWYLADDKVKISYNKVVIMFWLVKKVISRFDTVKVSYELGKWWLHKNKICEVTGLLAYPEGAIWKKRRCKKLDFFGG